jgi:phosphoribosylformylglycinamidine synthase
MDEKIIKEHGLTRKEYDLIVQLIGREPNLTELGIFSLMWSEHCSYKSSRVHLKKLPVEGDNVIQGPGENAGVLDIGDDMAVVFKIESHNHPSFIEPYQGAATGVGGILRDIFTMGARPIATLDSLRFGPLDKPRNRTIMEGVVSGIAGYGNSIGIPTVGGEIYFDDCYSLNPLVNVFSLGLAKKDKIFLARAEGSGNAVLYVGSKTGRDGIHGATMASAEFGEDLEEKRPNVQVGDPFKEKLLLEACLEVMEKNLVLGIQDMGAAGLTCSTVEMAANSGAGIEIDLDRVPQREAGMTPYEIMLSESQERMLIVASRDKVPQVQDVFAKWDLDAVVIGQVTNTGRLNVKSSGKTAVDIPVEAVVNLCPAYTRDVAPHPSSKAAVENNKIHEPADYNRTLLELVSSATLSDKEWVFRQYDYMVQVNTAVPPGGDAAVLRLKHSRKGLAATLDGNSLYTYFNPRRGAEIAVAEACRNLSCVGAEPIGVTNCLNFGNPEKPEIMWQFQEVVEGMAAACRHFGIPVTGGNVSFYNDTEGISIHPTPVLGVVGIIPDMSHTVTSGFQEENDRIVLLGRSRGHLGASQYLKLIHGKKAGPAPEIYLDEESRLHELIREAAGHGWLHSAHDISEGGLAVCLAESCFHSRKRLGFKVHLNEGLRSDLYLFGEEQSRVVVSINAKNIDSLIDNAHKKGVPAAVIGETGGTQMIIEHKQKTLVDLPVETAYLAWKQALPERFAVK